MALVKTKNEPKAGSPTNLVRFLSSAVDMEEQFSNSVYHDYLDPEDWPADLKPDVFEIIRKNLTVLIEDSKKHEDILRELTRQYSKGKRDKRTMTRELELMEGFELSAKEFYTRICSHPQIREKHVKETFQNLADAEQRHAKIVREIIDLLNNV